MLAQLKDILKEAEYGGFGIGAFNSMNLEISQAIVEGAKRVGKPIVMQVTENAIKYAGLKTIFGIISSVIENDSSFLPIAIHLDHGKNLEVIKACVDLGFSSVHCDASALPFEDNIKLTKLAADYGHERDIVVQGELGSILGKEGLLKFHQEGNLEKYLTKPEEIAEFVERTGVDTVAVALGNMHGNFVGVEKIDLERLRRIKAMIKIPIVLHGGSGLPDEQVKQAIKLGVRIINIDTELRIAFVQGLKSALNLKNEKVDPREIMAPVKSFISDKVEQKCKLFSDL